MKNPFNNKNEQANAGASIGGCKKPDILAKMQEPKLQCKHFQTPEDLCVFVNSGDISILTICPYDRFQIVYYY